MGIRSLEWSILAIGRGSCKICFLVLCALIQFVSVRESTAADAYTKHWQSIADKSHDQLATPAGKAYESAAIKAHNTFWKDVYLKCKPAALHENIQSFRAAMVIDAEGKIVEFLLLPQSENLQCFADNMLGRHYPKPPEAPFYETIDVALRANSK